MPLDVELTQELVEAADVAVEAFNRAVYESAALNGRGPTLDELKMMLQETYGPLLCAVLEVDSATIEDHVEVKVDDLDGTMTRFKMNLEPRTDAGQSLIELVNWVSITEQMKKEA